MNQAEQALKKLLEPDLRQQGFKSQPSGLSFKRRTSFGFHELVLPSFARVKGGPYVVNVGLGVRHNQVDDVVNRLGHIWGASNQRNTTTVYRGLGHFPFDLDRDGEQTISAGQIELDAQRVASAVKDMLLFDGYGFFRKFSDLRECSNGLNDPTEAIAHPLLNSFPLRAYYGVVAAALTQTEPVSSLIQSYVDFSRRSHVVDNGVYEVGKELCGTDAIATRLEFVAEAARLAAL